MGLPVIIVLRSSTPVESRPVTGDHVTSPHVTGDLVMNHYATRRPVGGAWGKCGRVRLGSIAVAAMCVMLVAMDGGTSWAAEPASPIVGSFERLARHGDIEAELSGRLLLSELSCTACHAPPNSASASAVLEPKAGPKLEAVGRRLRMPWITRFLIDPAAIKPGTTMPDVLGHLDTDARAHAAAALTAFLASQLQPLPTLKASGASPVPHEFWNKGDEQAGARTFHQVGCVACHEPAKDYEVGTQTESTIDRLLEELEPEEIARLGLTHAARSVASIPLPSAKEKYTPQGLAFFLLEPALVRPAGRMPNMKLGTVESADLVAYLGNRASVPDPQTAVANAKAPNALAAETTLQGAPDAATVAALRDEGRRLFVDLGCSQCHSASGIARPAKFKSLVSLDVTANRSCISQLRGARIPHFELDDAQRQSIIAALQAIRLQFSTKSTVLESANALVQFTLMQLNCYACHQRDAVGGIALGRTGYFETNGQADLGDEGRLPPPLTNVGSKLNAPWLKRVLQGTGDIRPHLQIRMPRYPMPEVEPLVPLLASADRPLRSAQNARVSPTNGQVDRSLGDRSLADRSLAETGRELFNVGCVQCHPVRGEALPSVVGVDVGHIGLRVQRAWFDAFLLNPASLKARTRMPTFFAAGSVNQDFYHGDVDKQIDSLWAYLEDVDRLPLPEKIEQVRRQNFELIPTERPIILRTFMRNAGTHAIAGGFPEHVNFAFDAETVRLSDVWRGRFLDAQGTWNDRFAPDALPLSTAVAISARGPDFALLTAASAPWPDSVRPTSNLDPRFTLRFDGYRLDPSGMPTLQYRLGNWSISDSLRPLSGESEDSAQTSKPPDATGLLRILTVKLDAEGATKPSGPVAGQLWFRSLAGARLTHPRPTVWVNETGVSMTVPAAYEKSVVTRLSGGQNLCLMPMALAGETTFQIEYHW